MSETQTDFDDLKLPEQDAFALARAAVMLDQARRPRATPEQMSAALDHNLQLWVGIRTLAGRTDNHLPADVRENLIRLSHFVAQKTFECAEKIEASTIDTLINLDLQISEGLLEGAQRQEIQRRAYEIWEAEGCPHGRDSDHWNKAEAEIREAIARQAQEFLEQAAVEMEADAPMVSENTASPTSATAAGSTSKSGSSSRSSRSRSTGTRTRKSTTSRSKSSS